ncbi:stage III sporulation protein AB [Alkalithermobacter thermoalcaliphilus JW-YL-7 = DSM 7308]|uniref:Sporulation stage III protein AB n=1 Tax=Alkalithermobacter thermoalcaliphilus JW-YL-7 = DSM 7308 TaxID=1121328 RepID=A0A150FPT4_CLOPD|nr:Sporulation stage III protein AB [[Clostridium] paradoxum JW-YL-7 = DSM 7308]SHK95117.1 stage III sporulation protein AB [[Clostridium] paradoxum JW-YL-7 = DSM 7308]
MLVRSLLILIILVSSFFLGEEIHSTYKKRNKDVSDLIKLLEILNMELRFGLYTLSEAFFKISQKKDFRLCEFFYNLANKLETENDNTLEDAFDGCAYLLYEKTFLKAEEIEELKNLILNLGKSDFYSQENIIKLGIENIKKIQKKTQEEVLSKGLLYKKISVIMGLLLVIILL